MLSTISLPAIGADISANTLQAPVETIAPENIEDIPTLIDNLTKKIITKEIELEKFNLHYKLEVGKQGRWASWRYALLQETNYALNLASGIASTDERASHFTTPERTDRYKLGNSNLISMIGYIIGASAAALELGITEWHDLQARHKGFSPKAAKKYVLDLKEAIDRLIAERDALIKIEQAAPLLSPHLAIDIAEGKVLKDLHDLALLEYQKFNIGERRYLTFQKSLLSLK